VCVDSPLDRRAVSLTGTFFFCFSTLFLHNARTLCMNGWSTPQKPTPRGPYGESQREGVSDDRRATAAFASAAASTSAALPSPSSLAASSSAAAAAAAASSVATQTGEFSFSADDGSRHAEEEEEEERDDAECTCLMCTLGEATRGVRSAVRRWGERWLLHRPHSHTRRRRHPQQHPALEHSSQHYHPEAAVLSRGSLQSQAHLSQQQPQSQVQASSPAHTSAPPFLSPPPGYRSPLPPARTVIAASAEADVPAAAAAEPPLALAVPPSPLAFAQKVHSSLDSASELPELATAAAAAFDYAPSSSSQPGGIASVLNSPAAVSSRSLEPSPGHITPMLPERRSPLSAAASSPSPAASNVHGARGPDELSFDTRRAQDSVLLAVQLASALRAPLPIDEKMRIAADLIGYHAADHAANPESVTPLNFSHRLAPSLSSNSGSTLLTLLVSALGECAHSESDPPEMQLTKDAAWAAVDAHADFICAQVADTYDIRILAAGKDALQLLCESLSPRSPASLAYRLAECLMRRGCSVAARSRTDGKTTLERWASFAALSSACGLLLCLQHGADLDAQDIANSDDEAEERVREPTGHTALHWLVHNRNAAVLMELAGRGWLEVADLSRRSRLGETPLQLAQRMHAEAMAAGHKDSAAASAQIVELLQAQPRVWRQHARPALLAFVAQEAALPPPVASLVLAYVDGGASSSSSRSSSRGGSRRASRAVSRQLSPLLDTRRMDTAASSAQHRSPPLPSRDDARFWHASSEVVRRGQAPQVILFDDDE